MSNCLACHSRPTITRPILWIAYTLGISAIKRCVYLGWYYDVGSYQSWLNLANCCWSCIFVCSMLTIQSDLTGASPTSDGGAGQGMGFWIMDSFKYLVTPCKQGVILLLAESESAISGFNE